MTTERLARALTIARGWLVQSASDPARASDAEYVLDVLSSIQTQPHPPCPRGPERCDCLGHVRLPAEVRP